VVQGEYHVERLLGEDDLGPIYEAHNPRRKGRYALLFLRRELRPPLKMMAALRNDLRRAREIQGLLPIEPLADERGDACFAIENLPGESLAERLARGPLPPATALSVIGTLGRALQALHNDGLLHGRLRAAHVLLVSPDAKGPRAGQILLRWHALHPLLVLRLPELQRSKAPQAEPRTDVQALGLLLFHCLSGQQPDGDGAPLLTPAPEHGLTPELVKTLNVVLAAACAADAAARPDSIEEVLRALRQVARGAGLVVPGEESGARAGNIARRLSGLFRTLPAPSKIGRRSRVDLTPIPRPRTTAPPVSPGTALTPSEGILLPITPPAGTPVTPPAGTPVMPSGPPAGTPVMPAAPPAGTPAAAAPPPAPARQGPASGPPPPPPQTLERPTMLLARVVAEDGPKEVRGENTMRMVRPRDITQLVEQVQLGQVDPDAAITQASLGEDVGLRGLLSHPLVAAALGGLGMLLLILLFRCGAR
jgi:serine/threonine-protein kinase